MDQPGRAAGGRPLARRRRPAGWWWSWSLGLLLKNVLSYASTQISVRAQEGLVRDLRARLFDHLLTLDLGFFQRTRAGQLISGMITEVDQTKTVITASLVSLFQNLVVVATTLVVLSQISFRLTLLTLAFVPLLVLLLQPLLRRLRRHARARTRRARGDHRHRHRADRRHPADPRLRRGSARERPRSRAQATRYRKQVIRTQRFSSLTSPLTEVFSGLSGDPDHLGRHPARARRAGRAARARGDHRLPDGGAQAHLAAQDDRVVSRGRWR